MRAWELRELLVRSWECVHAKARRRNANVCRHGDALSALAIGSEVFFKSVPVLRATLEKRIPIDKFIICLDLNQIAFMFQLCRFTIRNAQ